MANLNSQTLEDRVAKEAHLLDGIKVVDLSQYIPGPYTTLKLLELGAEVTKVEPLGGEPMRYFGVESKPRCEPKHVSPVYLHLNSGKQIIELDLKRPEGKAQLTNLLEAADVLVAGFRPGVLKRLGFGKSALERINPKLIVCHISGFEVDGPRAQRGGHDLGYLVSAGLYTPRESHNKVSIPPIVFPPVADHAGALQALSLINAALFRQAKTGECHTLEVSIFSAVDDWGYMFKSAHLHKLLGGDAAFYQFYLTSDQQLVSIAAIEVKFWKAFCEAVSRPTWISRQQEALPQYDLIKDLSLLFSTQSLDYWKSLLAETDCCFEVIS